MFCRARSLFLDLHIFYLQVLSQFPGLGVWGLSYIPCLHPRGLAQNRFCRRVLLVSVFFNILYNILGLHTIFISDLACSQPVHEPQVLRRPCNYT